MYSPARLVGLCLSVSALGGNLITLPAQAASPPATWTTGHKKVLIIPVRFTDFGGPSDTPSSSGTLSGWGNIVNGNMTSEISAFMARQSYGKCTMEFTVLPEVNMGVSYTDYNAPLNSDSTQSKFTRFGEPGSFLDDARARARLAGMATANPAMYDTDNYDLDIICTGFIPGQGAFDVGVTHGKGIYANLFDILPHEICHNLGLSHAWGASRPTFAMPMSPRGSFWEDKYGNVFDLMGNKNRRDQPIPPDQDAGAYWKYALGWLDEAFIGNATSSGMYRIHPIDAGSVESGKLYALRIPRDPTHTYWLEQRQNSAGQDALWASNGLLVQFGAESYLSSSGDTYLLDMTPGSRGFVSPNYSALATMRDAPLALGRTFSDPEANIHITPIRKGGTTPESFDIVVNHGPFPSNNAPTLSIAPAIVAGLTAGTPQVFTASALDADGDTLAYFWEFDDPDAVAGVSAGGINADTRLATQGVHTWTRNGTFLVRCTVSDMKGGKRIASAQVTVTGGTSARLTITGVVSDENGVPLAGAIVNNFNGIVTQPQTKPLVNYGATNFVASGETGADGKFSVQIPSTHVTGTVYRLTAMHGGYSFSCTISSGNITVNSTNVSGVNFNRIRANRTISGSVAVAGRAYDPATDGPLTIQTGAGSVNASTGYWTTSVPDGSLVNVTATAANPAYTLTSSFSNPYRVASDYLGFYFAVNIPGKMPETGFATTGVTSNDTAGTVQIPISMTLPPGYTTWVQSQSFFYWIDPASTAEYGVDYKMTGGELTFFGNKVPGTRFIPLKVIPTGQPKLKTIILKIGVASNVANLGPISTFTYTIHNPDPQAALKAFIAAAFPGSSDSAVIDPASDPDHDGAPNFLEFALKGDPASSGNRGLSIHRIENLEGGAGEALTLILAFREGAIFQAQPDGSQKNINAVDALHCSVQGSRALDTFDQSVLHKGPSFLAPPESGLPPLTGTGWEYHTFHLAPPPGGQRGFLRVLVDME